MNYQWKFSNLMVASSWDGLPDVITSVNFRLAAVNGPCAAYHKQLLNFSPADPDSFIAFNQITEETMIRFVEAKMGEELDEIKHNLVEQFNESTITERPLPWLGRGARDEIV